MGEMLKATESERAKGTAGMGRPKKGSTPREPPKDSPTLADLGLTRKEASGDELVFRGLNFCDACAAPLTPRQSLAGLCRDCSKPTKRSRPHERKADK
jgi:hypothetical protein